MLPCRGTIFAVSAACGWVAGLHNLRAWLGHLLGKIGQRVFDPRRYGGG